MSDTVNFELEGVKVALYPSAEAGRPAIYLNSYEGEETYKRLSEMGCKNFSLVAMGVRDWFCDLVPWTAASPFKDGRNFVGGGGEYLNLLTERIMPAAEERLPAISWRGIAGYSLGGLFAVWSLYNCSEFSCMASMSGSLWFEGFASYICTHKRACSLTHAYFSLGDREAGGVHSPVRTVAANTLQIVQSYRADGISTDFVWEKGGHTSDPVGRVARGIARLLEVHQ